MAPPQFPAPKRGARVEKKRAKKDPNSPKRPLNAYMFYSQANRERVRSENPGSSSGQVGTILSESWKRLSDTARAPYLKQEEEDKQRARHEREAYDAPS